MNISITTRMIGGIGADNGISIPQAVSIGPSGPVISFSYLTGTLPSSLILARASRGTYFDSAGSMQIAAENTPRIDYDPVTLGGKGLLLEQKNTNYMTPAEVIKASDWTLRNVTLVDAGDEGLMGQKALRLTTSTTGQNCSLRTNGVGAAGSTMSITWFISPGTATKVQIYADTYGSSDYVNFDLANLTTSGNDGASIKKLASGVIEISAQFSFAGAAFFYLSPINSMSDTRAASYTGSVGDYFIAYSGDIRASFVSSNYHDSHIYNPTANVYTTRAADALTAASLPGNGDIYREYIKYGTTTVTREIVPVSAGILPSSFNGWLRTLKVWNRSLSATEKAAILA